MRLRNKGDRGTKAVERQRRLRNKGDRGTKAAEEQKVIEESRRSRNHGREHLRGSRSTAVENSGFRLAQSL
jgi:hypothetical protein